MKKMILILFMHIIISSLTHATTLDIALNHQKNEQFTEAINCFEKIIAQDPQDLNAYFNLGCCHLAIGNKEKACAAFEQVLEIHPHAFPAQYNLGYAYKTFGDI